MGDPHPNSKWVRPRARKHLSVDKSITAEKHCHSLPWGNLLMCLYCNFLFFFFWWGWGVCQNTALCAITFVFHEGFQLLFEAFVPARDVDVQWVITTGSAVGALPPLLVCNKKARSGIGEHVVNWGNTAEYWYAFYGQLCVTRETPGDYNSHRYFCARLYRYDKRDIFIVIRFYSFDYR